MNDRRISVLHAVTDSLSTVLMRGQLTYLRNIGYDPILLSSPGKEVDRIRMHEGLSVITVPMRREISMARDLRSLIGIWRLLGRTKPTICNSGTPKAGLLVGISAWLVRVPCRVYTLRGLRLETATGPKRIILTLTERLACGCAHRVICVSPSLRERAIALGLLPRSKAVVLGAGSSNGVDPVRFVPTPERLALAEALREQVGIRPDQQVVGFVGRFTKDKGVEELVAAFKLIQAKSPKAVLLLIGDYEEGDPISENIKNAIELDHGIRCVGFKAEIELYYLIMNVFVLPTHREGFPNAILEAQAAGLPVVTTKATGAVDAIDDGVTGLLTPVGDSQELAEAILSLLHNPTKGRVMGLAGRDRVLKKFRNEIIWEELSRLYTEMLRERGYPIPSSPCVETMRCVQT